MKLTSKGRYAVMALADLANFNKTGPVPLRDISIRQGISLLYLEQIFLKLKKHNIVKSTRGSGGGYVLFKNADDLKLSEIFSAVDEKVKTINCKRESKKDAMESHQNVLHIIYVMNLNYILIHFLIKKN